MSTVLLVILILLSCRCVAYLASQRELGLCAKRRPRLGVLILVILVLTGRL